MLSVLTQATSANGRDVVKALSNTISSGARNGSVEQLNGVWARFYNSLYREAIAVWPHVLTGIVILIVFWVLARIAKFCIVRAARRVRRRKEIYKLLGQVVKIAINLIGIVTALGTMGINITALITGLGLTGFAVGLALKDPISNAISGFMVLFYEPFKVGDKIVFSDKEGTVEKVQLRYTILTNDDKRYLIPNSSLLTNIITVNDELVEPIQSKRKTKSRSRKSS